MAPSRPLPVRGSRTGAAQRLAVLGLVALIAWLWWDPERGLPFFWSGVLPLVPLVLLIHPGLWRNVCPLATLSMGRGPGRPSTPSGPGGVVAPVLLLLALIALRPLGLEDSGPATAGLLVGLGGAALWGRRSDRKAGFCNRLCPLLAVERLYGQAPLTEVGNARCPTCTLCTPRGCLDLSPRAATAQLLGPGRREGAWAGTPLGGFAAAFPGVIVAFFLLPPDPAPSGVAARLIAGAVLSWGVVASVTRLLRPRWEVAFRAVAATSAALFCVFALPGTAAAWGAPRLSGILVAAGLAVVAVWTLRTPFRTRMHSHDVAP